MQKNEKIKACALMVYPEGINHWVEKNSEVTTLDNVLEEWFDTRGNQGWFLNSFFN
jgi:hypothetical protein